MYLVYWVRCCKRLFVVEALLPSQIIVTKRDLISKSALSDNYLFLLFLRDQHFLPLPV